MNKLRVTTWIYLLKKSTILIVKKTYFKKYNLINLGFYFNLLTQKYIKKYDCKHNFKHSILKKLNGYIVKKSDSQKFNFLTKLNNVILQKIQILVLKLLFSKLYILLWIMIYGNEIYGTYNRLLTD